MNSEHRDRSEVPEVDAGADFGDPVVDPSEAGVAQDQAAEAPRGEESPDAMRIQRELDQLQERHLRLAAEYENFRKRNERERAELWDRAQGQLVGKLLDVLDDLERITRFTPAESSAESVVEGIKLIDRKFFRTLEAAGLEPVPIEEEKFDPEHHEALMMTPTADPSEDGMVGNVFQPGYRFKGSLLRPARVQVKRLE